MYDVVINGYVSIDRVIKIDKPASCGFTSIIQNKNNANINFGGCSTNIAYLMAKLNKKALPIIRLGENDTADLGFYDCLKKAGVCMDAVEIVPDETTSNCYLVLDENKNHITLFYPGAMDGKYSKQMETKFFNNSKYAILTVGSYEDNIEFFNRCKKANIPLVFGMKSDFQAFPVEFLKEILLNSEIIFTNEVERAEIESLYNFSSLDVLLEKGKAKIIVTTLGKHGSMYAFKTKDGIVTGKIPAAELNKPVDTTGCGDAYIAGFMYAILNGEDVEACCNYGSVLSSFIIEKVGCITNAPNQLEFKERYNKLITKDNK